MDDIGSLLTSTGFLAIGLVILDYLVAEVGFAIGLEATLFTVLPGVIGSESLLPL